MLISRGKSSSDSQRRRNNRAWAQRALCESNHSNGARRPMLVLEKTDSEDTFCRRNTTCAWVDLDRLAQRPRSRLENCFDHVMRVAAIMANDVQGQSCIRRYSPPKFFGQGSIERTEHFPGHLSMPDTERPAAHVDSRRHQRFIHRHSGVAIAADAGLIAQRLRQRLAVTNAYVFNGVMGVHVQVSLRLHGQVDETVASQQ